MRPNVVRLAVPAALLTLALAGCAPAPIYKPTANNAAVPPSQVAREPERYGTSDVIWGGRIVQVRNFADHSEIEILAYPLDGSQRPQSNDTGNVEIEERIKVDIENTLNTKKCCRVYSG